uniref:Uncharacterized protein n=1 Tax=Triticum urartu TaxID=4572 RepID=A0A8R7R2N9_TRIUA
MWMPTAGTRAQGIYKLRALRRKTLFWIKLLYRSSTPLSRSSILHSNARNCSSLHTTLLFCNVLETRDHLGISICFDKMQDMDSRSEMPDVRLELASSSSPLFRTNKSSWTVIFSSIKVSCMALQRSSTTRD